MDSFNKDKSRKLERMFSLRVMHYLGMVSWEQDVNGGAKQNLRGIHPFVWIWLFLGSLISVLVQGVPETYKEVVYTIKNDMVWF